MTETREAAVVGEPEKAGPGCGEPGSGKRAMEVLLLLLGSLVNLIAAGR
jgi:hypothetical protein